MGFQKTKPIKLKKWEDENLESFEISPDLYTHLTILEALKAMPNGLETGKAENGLIALTISVDQLEQILISRNLLQEGDSYFSEVDAKERELKGQADEGVLSLILQARLANFKLGRLLKISFSTTTKEGEFTM